MKEYRCNKCNKLLCRRNFKGIVEIMCNRCKEIIVINAERLERQSN